MLKLIGFICMIAGGAGVGYSMSVQMGRRYEVLRELKRMVALLMGEITYGYTPLPEGLEQISIRLAAPVRDFVEDLSLELRSTSGETFSQMFARAAKVHFRASGLEDQDLRSLCRLGCSLGYLDCDMQLRNLRLYEAELTQQMEALYEILPGRRKLYRTLGLMGGLFLVILLL